MIKQFLSCILLSASALSLVNVQAADNAMPKNNLVDPATKAGSDSKTTQVVGSTEMVDPKAAVCLIYAGGFDFWSLAYTINIYSTFKVEKSCNEVSYQKLTLASIAAQLKAVGNPSHTVRGGYHRQLMSVNLSPVSAPYYEIGNIKFSPIGKIKLRLIDIIQKKVPTIEGAVTASYTPFQVDTNIYYIWNIGDLIHRLIAPNGDQYIMYSYTNQVTPDLSREGLVKLGNLLDLPTGWKYESILLSKTVTVRTSALNDFKATTIFDEMNNYYVRYAD